MLINTNEAKQDVHGYNWAFQAFPIRGVHARSFVKAIDLFVIVTAVFCILPASTLAAGSNLSLRGHYFLVVWGYQGPDNDVVDSHTFVSFYKGDDLAKGVVHPATISWLPATGVVAPFGSAPGHNFTLGQTLEMACHSGRQVKSWGPYEIEPALYQRALKRVRLLRSGRVQYSMIDTASDAMNCIDAAGDITPAPFDSGIAWGFVASQVVVRHLSPYFIKSEAKVQSLKRILARQACSRPATAE